MTPLQAYNEFDRVSFNAYKVLRAMCTCARGQEWPKRIDLPRTRRHEVTSTDRETATRSVDLARFLHMITNFSSFCESIVMIAIRHLPLDLDEAKYRLPLSGPTNNFMTEIQKHLKIDVAAATCTDPCGHPKRIDPLRVIEYCNVRHQWMHEAGRLSPDFVGEDAPTLANEGWWDDLDRCWVLREPPDFTSPLEQVVWDVNGLVRWLAPEIERKHEKLKGRVVG